tara:strand:+ start:360 stop:530 length:171 start_codon:yes stop_codon:yes gene_type:complete
MTFDELQELRDAITDIMIARDFLASKGIDVGIYQINNISNALYELPDEEDCEDYPK